MGVRGPCKLVTFTFFFSRIVLGEGLVLALVALALDNGLTRVFRVCWVPDGQLTQQES